jgi:MYXO-CTERM domain-containing protein
MREPQRFTPRVRTRVVLGGIAVGTLAAVGCARAPSNVTERSATAGAKREATNSRVVRPEPPTRPHPDVNGNKVSDSLELVPAGSVRAAPDWVDLHLILKQPVTAENVTAFQAAGGEVLRVYERICFGFRGRIPRASVATAAERFGHALIGAYPVQSLVPHLDEVTRALRARPTWTPAFTDYPSGFSGAGTTIAFLDSGVDASHPDLALGERYFRDFTTDAVATASDARGHGTAVAGVALGTGLAFGAGPGALRFTAHGTLTGVAAGSGFRNPFHAPVRSRVRLSATATFTGGTTTQLAFADAPDGTQSWVAAGSRVSGPSPLTLTIDYGVSSLYHQSFVLLAPAGLFAVATTLDTFPASTEGTNPFRGVAPGAHWAGFKVVRNDGISQSSDVLDALEALVTPPPGESASLAAVHGIKVVNISIGTNDASAPELRAAVNTLVSNGLLPVVSAGNGPTGRMPDPARARGALTVGASSDADRLAEYSQLGFSASDPTEGNKPDVLAPGGSVFRSHVLAPDSNQSDASDPTFADVQANDYVSLAGTTLAAAATSGAAALIIEALESVGRTWVYGTDASPNLVKMLLLAGATETNRLREGGTSQNSPKLGRAATPHDPYEGFGLVNVDASIEAVRLGLAEGFTGSTSGAQRAFGRNVTILAGKTLDVALEVTSGTPDLDLYLYSSTPNPDGIPALVASSTSAVAGGSETLRHTSTSEATYYLFVKTLAGTGSFTLSSFQAECGDEVVEEGEECDDGNVMSGDCCDSACRISAGICSDGNACTVGDACTFGTCASGDAFEPDGTACSGGICTAGSCVPLGEGSGGAGDGGSSNGSVGGSSNGGSSDGGASDGGSNNGGFSEGGSSNASGSSNGGSGNGGTGNGGTGNGSGGSSEGLGGEAGGRATGGEGGNAEGGNAAGSTEVPDKGGGSGGRGGVGGSKSGTGGETASTEHGGRGGEAEDGGTKGDAGDAGEESSGGESGARQDGGMAGELGSSRGITTGRSSGCACSSSPRDGRTGWSAALALMFALGARRRRAQA